LFDDRESFLALKRANIRVARALAEKCPERKFDLFHDGNMETMLLYQPIKFFRSSEEFMRKFVSDKEQVVLYRPPVIKL